MVIARSSNVEIWKHPACYAGFSPDGDYVLLSKHHNSLLIDKHNWDVACETLHAAPYNGGIENTELRPYVYHWRARCSMVGWIEYLMIRADAPAKVIEQAQGIAERLEGYPILDEDKYSEKEYAAVSDYWEHLSVRDRVDYCTSNGITPFAGRHYYLPLDDSGALYDALREGI